MLLVYDMGLKSHLARALGGPEEIDEGRAQSPPPASLLAFLVPSRVPGTWTHALHPRGQPVRSLLSLPLSVSGQHSLGTRTSLVLGALPLTPAWKPQLS